MNNTRIENLLITALKKSCQQLSRRCTYHSSGAHTIVQKETKQHPYRKIHPWKSLRQFTDYLLNNVIYNKDGLVAINKPYGISGMGHDIDQVNGTLKLRNNKNSMVNPCHYSISDSLPYIASELGYSNLTYVKGPERYMSGVTFLAENEHIIKSMKKSLARAIGMHILPSTYWVITTRIPIELKGKMKLAMKLQIKGSQKKAVIVKEWHENEEKRQDVKILNVEFQVLSNSTQNLNSLLEIKASTRKWHAIRLFAATVLHSPVLGDNFYGSRIQKVMNAYLNVNPFLESTEDLPVLNKDLLQLLYLTASKQEIIPTHIHLRKIHLPWMLGKNKDLIIEASLLPPFDWTCEQLQFKYIQNLSENNSNIEMTNKSV